MNMKYFLPGTMAIFLMASCADEFNPEYEVEQPVDVAKIAELAEFKPLKEYIDRSAHPTMKLGAALDVKEFNKKLTVYNVAVTNFDEVVAGNAMKFASCVDSKGKMDFSAVETFVDDAKEAGLTIFGHTLAWHSQQQPKWLSSLVPGGSGGSGGGGVAETTKCVVVRATDMVENPWDNQFFLKATKSLNAGDVTKISFRYRADAACTSAGTQCHTNPSEYIHWAAIGSFNFTTEWQEFEADFTIPAECDGKNMQTIAFNLNDYASANNYYFDDFKWTINGESLVVNGDCEGDDVSCYFSTVGKNGPNPATIETYTSGGGSGGGGGSAPASKVRCYVVHATDMVADPWDNQFWIMSNRVLQAGEKTKLSFRAKAAEAASIGTQSHAGAGEYIHWAAMGSVNFSTEWQDFEWDFTIPAECDGKNMQSIAFNLNDYADANDYYIDDVSWTCGDEQLVSNGDASTDDKSSFFSKVSQGAPGPCPIEEFTEGGGGSTVVRAIAVHATDMVSDPWDNQFWIGANRVLQAGEVTNISFTCKAKNAASIGTQSHAGPGAYLHWAAIGNVNFSTEWTDFETSFTIPAECDGKDMQTIAFNLNDYADANDYYFCNFKWTCGDENLLVNGDLSSDDTSSFFTKISQGSVTNSAIEEVVEQTGGGSVIEVTKTYRVIEVKAGAMVENPWDHQFFLTIPGETFEAGKEFTVKMTIKADKPASPGTQAHAGPGEYIHWAAIGNPQFTTKWTDFEWTGTVPAECAGKGMHTIAFNLNDYADENTYYFRDLSWVCDGKEYVVNGNLATDDATNFVTATYGKGQSPSTIKEITETTYEEETPMSPEEKKMILTNVLDQWIGGMMDATQGYVTAWDVVNEAISGGGNVDGRYDLQHADPSNPDDAKNNFYWQDYLGNEDYVRIVVGLARKHFERQENKAGDLKLFINDYNLESWWDDNKKLESLIGWIKVWESDGETKIDGIGSQMHVSYYENATTQADLEKHIVKMLEMMAKSGKLCRISELDMGYVKADGSSATLAEMTPEMEKKMESFYKWIIEQYMTIIPEPQKYGITQWCLTDSPAGSGWRADSPVGIWDTNWYRKYVYRGWTEGLTK